MFLKPTAYLLLVHTRLYILSNLLSINASLMMQSWEQLNILLYLHMGAIIKVQTNGRRANDQQKKEQEHKTFFYVNTELE
jgi:hypothetical protein